MRRIFWPSWLLWKEKLLTRERARTDDAVAALPLTWSSTTGSDASLIYRPRSTFAQISLMSQPTETGVQETEFGQGG